MIDKLWALLPTQALGIVLAFIAIWVIEPVTGHGMAVLAVIMIAFVNVVQQTWNWLAPKFGAPQIKPKRPRLARAKPKHRTAR